MALLAQIRLTREWYMKVMNMNEKTPESKGEPQQRSRSEIMVDILNYLEDHSILTMATCNLDAVPDATALEYVSIREKVYVTCRPSSRKVSNINENPKVAYEIHDDIPINKQSIKNLQALQVFATGKVLKHEESEFRKAFEAMKAKFPIFNKVNEESRAILCFSPVDIWFLNYARKFFLRERVSFK